MGALDNYLACAGPLELMKTSIPMGLFQPNSEPIVKNILNIGGGGEWLSGRLETEGLLVRDSPEALCCVQLEQGIISSGSTLEDNLRPLNL